MFVRLAYFATGPVIYSAVDFCLRPAGSSAAWTNFQPYLANHGHPNGVPVTTITNYIGVGTSAVEVAVIAKSATCPLTPEFAAEGVAVASSGYYPVAAATNPSGYGLVADESSVVPAARRMRLFTIAMNAPVSDALDAVSEPAADTSEAGGALPVVWSNVQFGHASPYLTFTPSPSPTPSPGPVLGLRWYTGSGSPPHQTTDFISFDVFANVPSSTSPYTYFDSSNGLGGGTLCSDAPTSIDTSFTATCATVP